MLLKQPEGDNCRAQAHARQATAHQRTDTILLVQAVERTAHIQPTPTHTATNPTTHLGLLLGLPLSLFLPPLVLIRADLVGLGLPPRLLLPPLTLPLPLPALPRVIRGLVTVLWG